MIISDNQVKIDTSQIPESVRDEICRVLLHSVKEYFRDPKHEEDYQRWLVEYKKRIAYSPFFNALQHGPHRKGRIKRNRPGNPRAKVQTDAGEGNRLLFVVLDEIQETLKSFPAPIV